MSNATETKRRMWIRILFTIVVVVALDQVTKLLILARFQYAESLTIIPGFFDLTLAFNRGAAFGLFSNLPDGTREIVLFGVTIVAFGVVFSLLRSDDGHRPITQYAFGLIVGGAVGNIIDRVRLGMVVDFLDVYIGTNHWPAFNIADSAISIGVALLLLSPTKKQGKELPSPGPDRRPEEPVKS